MRAQKSHLCCLVFAVVAAGLIEGCSAEALGEPLYGGHPLRYWVEDLGTDGRSSVEVIAKWSSPFGPVTGHEEAKEAVKQAGTNAVPFLLVWIRDIELSMGAARAFRVLGPAARSAVPELARLATGQPEANGSPAERAVRSPAIFALAGIGPDSLDALSIIVTNSSQDIPLRRNAILGISSMEANAQRALPAMVRALSDKDEVVAATAAEAIGVIGIGQRAAIAALSAAVDDRREAVRVCGLAALGNFREEALPPLLHAFTNLDFPENSPVVSALVQAAPQGLTNKAVLAVLARSLCAWNLDRKLWASEALGAANQQARGQKPDLAALAREDSRSLLQDATNTIQRLAPELLQSSP